MEIRRGQDLSFSSSPIFQGISPRDKLGYCSGSQNPKGMLLDNLRPREVPNLISRAFLLENGKEGPGDKSPKGMLPKQRRLCLIGCLIL